MRPLRQLIAMITGLPAALGSFLSVLWQALRAPDGRRLRLLLSLAWPVILARLSQSVIGFCDALMIAPLGEDALAATATGAINAFTLVILPMGMAFIVQSFAAQFKGQGDLGGARRYAWYGLILAGLFLILSIACIPLCGPVLHIFPHSPAVHGLMTDYLVIRLLGVGAVVGTEVLGNWYGGLGNTRLHMIASMLAMVLNVVGNWLLIEGNLGFPAMGVKGAALASVLATWIGFAFLAVVFLRGAGTGVDRLAGQLGKLRLSWTEFVRMLRFGTPNGVNWFFEFAAFALFLNLVVADMGAVVQAAMMVVFQINSVSFMPAFGISSSGAILVGQAIGRGEHDDVPNIVGQTAAVAMIWQVSVGVLYVAIPTVLMGWFAPPTHNAGEFLAVGAAMLVISGAWQLFDAWAMTLSETLRAAGDTAWSMWARTTLAWALFTPSAYVSVRILGGGPSVAMLCLSGYLAVLALALIWRFQSGAWRAIDLTGRTGETLPTH